MTAAHRMGDKWETSVNSYGPRHPKWDTSVGDKCGRQVWETNVGDKSDKCKLKRPEAPRVGDKCGKQVGDKCGTQVWETSGRPLYNNVRNLGGNSTTKSGKPHLGNIWLTSGRTYLGER